MRVFLICSFSLLFISGAFAQAAEGFDYRRGMVQGRATVAGGRAAVQITGDAAEAMFYQMGGKAEKDTGCSRGVTKRLPGFICTKIATNNATPAFECFIDLNLNAGQVEENSGMCPDDETDAHLDGLGNKFPRSGPQR